VASNAQLRGKLSDGPRHGFSLAYQKPVNR